MAIRDSKIVISEIVLSVAAVGQIVLSFILYDKSGSLIVRNIGWITLCISAVFGWLPIYALKKYGKVPKGSSFVHTTELVDSGIYAILRHPQYLAGILMGLALFLIAQHWLVGLLGVTCILIYYISAFDEEKSAIGRFGEQYELYQKKVPRFNFILGLIRLLQSR